MKMGVGAYFREERKDPRMPSFLSSLHLAASRPCSNVTTQEPSLVPYPELTRVCVHTHTHTTHLSAFLFTLSYVCDPKPYVSPFYVVTCHSGVGHTRLCIMGQDVHDFSQCWVLNKCLLNDQPRA